MTRWVTAHVLADPTVPYELSYPDKQFLHSIKVDPEDADAHLGAVES